MLHSRYTRIHVPEYMYPNTCTRIYVPEYNPYINHSYIERYILKNLKKKINIEFWNTIISKL